ncbi:MAG TPA: glucoamylase family protein [Clostridia bacterium]|nr:glucoamylase family protein [Clostridia bacterium]
MIFKEVLGRDSFIKRAEMAAHSHHIKGKCKKWPRHLPKPQELKDVIENTYRRIASRYIEERSVAMPAEEWIADNYHFIKGQLNTFEDLGKQIKYLPMIERSDIKGYSELRIYSICSEIVEYTDGLVDEGAISDYLDSYQKISPLKTAELAVIAPMLRLALLNRIALVCKMTDRVTEERHESELMFNRYVNYIEGKGASNRALEKWISSVGDLSPVFAETILRLAAKWSDDTEQFRNILKRKLAGRGITLDELIAKEHKTRSALGVSVGNAITGLNNLTSIHWSALLKKLSIVEQILLKDPVDVFSKMGRQSRTYYVYLIDVYARRMGVSAESVAMTAIELASASSSPQHVGYYLYKEGYRDLKKAVSEKFKTRKPMFSIKPRGLQAGVMFLTSLAIFSVILGFLPLIYIIYAITRNYNGIVINLLLAAGLILPLLVIVQNIAIPILQKIFAKLYPPRPLPHMDFSSGIPDDCKVMCIIPAVIDSPERAKDLVRQLEILYLANREDNIYYSLVGDFKESPRQTEDMDRSIVKAAYDSVEELDKKYGVDNRFFFFYRERVFYEKENKYMGYERKRGAIIEFNNLLIGKSNSFKSNAKGDMPDIKYVLTIDADTFVPGGSIRQMVEIMEHPLNVPVVKDNVVVDGYGILQPSIVQGMSYKSPNFFTSCYSCQPGVDCYFSQTSDFYFDTCYEGIFTGKGMYNPALFNALLEDAFPDNSILSHDLIEGSYLRTAFASNIRFYDSFPGSYDSYVRRLHRWTRGDWQLLPFKKKTIIDKKGRKRKNPLNFLSIFKINANFIRSLLAPSVLLTYIIGMLALRSYFVFWHVLLAITMYLPFILSPSLGLLKQCTLRIVFLPHEAYVMADSIVRTLWRVYVSRKNLLSWVTSADSEKLTKGSFAYYCKNMWFSFIAAIIIPGITTPIWFFAPFVAKIISNNKCDKVVDEAENRRNRSIGILSRKIWAFYEDYAGKQDNYLPPDNVQFEPVYSIAHRTSPTNIGYLILSCVIAYNMGYITFCNMIERLENIMNTIDRMEKWKGHLYNWYDTISLVPLTPIFVSTVDSGNLMAALLCSAQIIRETVERHDSEDNKLYRDKVFTSQAHGLLDLINTLNEYADVERKVDKEAVESFLNNSEKTIEEWNYVLSHYNSDSNFENVNQNESTKAFALRVKLKGAVSAFIEELNIDSISICRDRANEIIKRMEDLALGFDFKPLYNEQKQLFSVGYSLNERRRSGAHYDIVASEARLTSYLAIAKGDVGYEHFFKMARRYSEETGVLLSWAGTTFEYLLPEAFFKVCEDSLWRKVCDIAVEIQMEYGKEYGIPWGVSESCFNAMEVNMNFKYKAFGVPELGIRRNPNTERVVSPYSSLMAIDRKPDEVIKNLERFKEVGAYGIYGYCEAVDYTQGRMGVVKSFMAHHLGMSFAAIANFALDDLIRENFSAIPLVESCKWLLTEKMPCKHLRKWKLVSGNHILGFLTKKAYIGNRKAYDDRQNDKKDRYNELGTQENHECNHAADLREITSFGGALPDCHLLSNGNYHVMITADGVGYSKCGEIGITRWFGGIEREIVGFFIYVRVRETGEVFSLTYNPVAKKADKQVVYFYNDRALFKRRDGDLESELEIFVSPEENAEIRRVKFTSNSEQNLHLEVTCVCELTMTSWMSHQSHPAYSDLMIVTEANPSEYTLIAKRKYKDEPSNLTYACMVASSKSGDISAFSYDTDFLTFMGRNRDYENPKSMEANAPLSGNHGAVITPCFSMRCMISVPAGESDTLAFTLGYAESRDAIYEIVDKFRNIRNTERALSLAETRCVIEQEYVEVLPGERKAFLSTLSHIVFMSPVRILFSGAISRGQDIVASLWELGISGDNPIVTVFAQKIENYNFLERMIRMWRFFSFRGFVLDLAIITEEGGEYVSSQKDAAESLAAKALAGSYHVRGNIYVIQPMEKNRRALECLLAASCIVLKPSSQSQENAKAVAGKEKLYRNMIMAGNEFALRNKEGINYTVPTRDLVFYNGYGGFSKDSYGMYNEYLIDVLYSQNRFITTPRPWINTITGTNFGFIVSESGSGSVWHINSRENRLTPWYNQLVRDPSGETIYIQNMKNGEYFSATPMPCGHNVLFEVRHGHGYSVFNGKAPGLNTELVVFAAQTKPVKLSLLSITNTTEEDMQLRLVYYVRPVLGDYLSKRGFYTVTSVDAENDALLANNYRVDKFGELTAFISSSLSMDGYTGDDLEFKGINGTLAAPAALLPENSLSNSCGAGLSPCMAMTSSILIKAGDTFQLVYMLGQTNSDEERVEIIKEFKSTFNAGQELNRVKEYWHNYVTQVVVDTPDKAMNILMNGWLLYQIKACRLEGRTAFYQSGGAFGFRDQLQDCLALLHVDPERVKKQILLHASRQYEEGDVQHWWHEPSGAGIRSRYSDDLLWLPYCVYYYCMHTQDYDILKIEVAYLKSPPLSDAEHDRYEICEVSELKESLIDHCIRAMKFALKLGKRGLPLMRGGDWNDGMNNVKGESVWLAWFLCTVMDNFKKLCKAAGIYSDHDFVQSIDRITNDIVKSIEEYCWDGNWYVRAFFEDGTPIGSHTSPECSIDSLAQSWSVISGRGDKERAVSALESAVKRLVDFDKGIIKLLTPAFTGEHMNPGYIAAYPPGIRENGAQYTHGSIWLAKALLEFGWYDQGYELLNILNPINHARTQQEVNMYKNEPYAVSADIYTDDKNIGLGGWSFYTGSASWLYKTMLEDFLGITRRGNMLIVNPRIPSSWPGYTIRYRFGNTVYHIEVKNKSKANMESKTIQLVDDGSEHKITI